MTIFSQFEARPDNYNKTGKKKKSSASKSAHSTTLSFSPSLLHFTNETTGKLLELKSRRHRQCGSKKIFSILKKYSFLLRLILFNFFLSSLQLSTKCKLLKQKIQFGPIVFDNYNGDIIV
jgi:hypothetical protein